MNKSTHTSAEQETDAINNKSLIRKVVELTDLVEDMKERGAIKSTIVSQLLEEQKAISKL